MRRRATEEAGDRSYYGYERRHSDVTKKRGCEARQALPDPDRGRHHWHPLPGNDSNDCHAWALWGNGCQSKAMRGNAGQCPALPPLRNIDTLAHATKRTPSLPGMPSSASRRCGSVPSRVRSVSSNSARPTAGASGGGKLADRAKGGQAGVRTPLPSGAA